MQVRWGCQVKVHKYCKITKTEHLKTIQVVKKPHSGALTLILFYYDCFTALLIEQKIWIYKSDNCTIGEYCQVWILLSSLASKRQVKFIGWPWV